MTIQSNKSSVNLTLPFRVTGLINERLLQFIWQFQYFNKSELTSTTGDELQIFFPGRYNTNQGPDFSEAKVRVGNATWVGSVELHLKSSDWKRHKHNIDENYQNVILHVVWDNDMDDGYSVATLELKERVPKMLLDRYADLMNTTAFIPCGNSIHSVKDITWKSWKERLLAERLIRKSINVQLSLATLNYHWEETFWRLVARNFGIKVNADAFEAIANSIPLTILSKHKNQIHQLEALLLGQAGLLNGKFQERYPQMLQKEYRFYKKKYGLQQITNPVFFLRMRPGNFPTIRLAQLAMLIYESAHLFSKIKDAGSVGEIRKWFEVTANDYWHYHYHFDETSPFKKKKLGSDMIDNIVINTIVPVLFAYGTYLNEEKYKQKALRWLGDTAAESNAITKGFAELSISNNAAFDSQALIELKNEYCDKKRCLDCAVGNAILHQDSRPATANS